MKTGQETKLRVIVDECSDGALFLRERIQKILAPAEIIDWTQLSKEHRAIPDAQILHRLLGPGTVLLTRDRVLHNQACDLGFRSYFIDEHGNLRRQRLPGISAPKPGPVPEHGPLKEDYSHAHNPIASALKTSFSERDFKRYKTRRRRIRSYFGAEAHLQSASLTIGARPARHGYICGFFLALAGKSGVKGIRASEGYALVLDKGWEPAWCLLHGLQELYLLQLENLLVELFIIPGDGLALCQKLLEARMSPTDHPPSEAARRLLNGLKSVRANPCLKGRFFDAMEEKLARLASKSSNELVPIQFGEVVARVLEAEHPVRHTERLQRRIEGDERISSPAPVSSPEVWPF